MPVLFCKALQLILLGEDLHMCVLSIAFSCVAVDELNFLPHSVEYTVDIQNL